MPNRNRNARMTAEQLIAEARANRTEEMADRRIDAEGLSDLLQTSLGYLLSDLDYNSKPESDGAVAARLLAVAIAHIDDITSNRTAPRALADC